MAPFVYSLLASEMTVIIGKIGSMEILHYADKLQDTRAFINNGDSKPEIPENILPFHTVSKEYSQIVLPGGEKIGLNGFKAALLYGLLPTNSEEPLLDTDAQVLLIKPGEQLSEEEASTRLLGTKRSLGAHFEGYGLPYRITNIVIETESGDKHKGSYLHHIELSKFKVQQSDTEPDPSLNAAIIEVNKPITLDTQNALTHENPALPLLALEAPAVTSTELFIQGAKQIDVLLAVLKECATDAEPCSIDSLAIKMQELYGWPKINAKPFTSMIIYKARSAGVAIVTTLYKETGRKPFYHLVESDHPLTSAESTRKLSKPSASSNEDEAVTEKPTTPEQPNHKKVVVQADDDEPSEIVDPIAKHIRHQQELQNTAKSRLQIEQYPDKPGLFFARIATPKGRTSQIGFTKNELHLLDAILRRNTPYKREDLELMLAYTVQSDTFDRMGGFEEVLDAVDTKIKAWKIQINLDLDTDEITVGALVEQNGSLQLQPIDRAHIDENLERFENRQRRRRPSHGKQRL